VTHEKRLRDLESKIGTKPAGDKMELLSVWMDGAGNVLSKAELIDADPEIENKIVVNWDADQEATLRFI